MASYTWRDNWRSKIKEEDVRYFDVIRDRKMKEAEAEKAKANLEALRERARQMEAVRSVLEEEKAKARKECDQVRSNTYDTFLASLDHSYYVFDSCTGETRLEQNMKEEEKLEDPNRAFKMEMKKDDEYIPEGFGYEIENPEFKTWKWEAQTAETDEAEEPKSFWKGLDELVADVSDS